MPRKSNLAPETPKAKGGLPGLQITINEFGEILTNMPVQELNSFLDENVEDKKFKGLEVRKRNETDDETQVLPQPKTDA